MMKGMDICFALLIALASVEASQVGDIGEAEAGDVDDVSDVEKETAEYASDEGAAKASDVGDVSDVRAAKPGDAEAGDLVDVGHISDVGTAGNARKKNVPDSKANDLSYRRERYVSQAKRRLADEEGKMGEANADDGRERYAGRVVKGGRADEEVGVEVPNLNSFSNSSFRFPSVFKNALTFTKTPFMIDDPDMWSLQESTDVSQVSSNAKCQLNCNRTLFYGYNFDPRHTLRA